MSTGVANFRNRLDQILVLFRIWDFVFDACFRKIEIRRQSLWHTEHRFVHLFCLLLSAFTFKINIDKKDYDYLLTLHSIRNDFLSCIIFKLFFYCFGSQLAWRIRCIAALTFRRNASTLIFLIFYLCLQFVAYSANTPCHFHCNFSPVHESISIYRL